MERGAPAFYEYHAALMEPWDGPAAVASPMAARSARRWTATACARALHRDQTTTRVIMASEAGVLPVDESTLSRSGGCSPARCC
jgi:glutamate synthase (NADPH/NADH) large chain